MSYTAKDIQTLDFRTAVRERVAMYMGSADNQGVLQCIREIVTNSIDEATMGFCDLIKITINSSKNYVRVVDNGRGVPFGKREDGTEAMEAIYTMAHSGGKFDEKIYQNVAGLNGIGAKGVALSSSYFCAYSYRDNQIATLLLKDGEKISFETNYLGKKDDGHHGTIVEFIPSQEVYNLEPINIDINEVKKMCRDWSYLMPGLTFEIYNDETNEKTIYCAKNGLLDMLKDNGKKAIHKTPLHISVKEDNIEVEIVMQWTDSRAEESHVFTNGLENSEGGTSLTGVKTSLTNFFKKKLKGEAPPEVLRKGLYYAVSCKVPNPSFSDQTKRKINNPELRGLCQRATTQMLEEFERRNGTEFEKIIELLTKEIKADAAAERARQQVLSATKEIEKNQKRKVFASDKLKDAEFLGQDSTLLIVEGDSALGGMSKARDYKKYGLLAIRGKILNCLSNSEEKIFQNEEIKLLLSAMNIIPGKYDNKKLRYGKLAICTDADSDGYHIGLLIMAALAYLAPQFIKEGRLCWLRAPLYVVDNKGKLDFYFTDEELNANRSKIKGHIGRNKGLGEMDSEEARLSMFTPQYQRLEVMEYSEEAIDLLYQLMGVAVEPRTQFIMDNIDFSKIRE